MCSETASPRISYSLDTAASIELHRHGSLSSYSSDPNHDFDFGVVFEHQVCSAEELFENGTIVPFSQGITIHCECRVEEDEVQPLPFRRSSPANQNTAAREIVINNIEHDHIPEETNVKGAEKKVTKSFWGFKRSSSLNSDDGNKVSLLCPLPDLSRSRSVSSVAANPNKMHQKQQQRQRSGRVPENAKPSSIISAYVCPSFPHHKSHSMRKSNNGGGGGGSQYNGSSSSNIRVSPVLNVPPHKGSSVSYFGLGCFYIRGKDKIKKAT